MQFLRSRPAAHVLLWLSVVSWCLLPVIVSAQETTKSGSQGYEQVCQEGEADAKRYHSGAGYGFAGFFCGVFGFAFASLSTPSVPAERLAGRPADEASTYTRCYRDQAKKKNTSAACTGWGLGAAVGLAVLAARSGSSTN